MKVRNYFASILVLAIMIGCSTTNSGFRKPDLSKVSVGMKKTDVIAVLGRPDDIATDGTAEYLEYGYDSPLDGIVGRAETYFVRLVGGVVESYGRKGDFGTTANPGVDVNVKQKVESRTTVTAEDQSKDLYVELRKLQQLRDDGVITEEEFQKLKAAAIAKAK